MGALIPNPHDLNVRNKLNNAFSDPHLRNLRNRLCGHGAAEPHFFSDPANIRHLARISFRLKIWPDAPQPPTPAELRARWIYLLQRLLTDPVAAAQNGTTVAEVIRDALQKFVVRDKTSCTAITFDVRHDTTLPSGIDYRADITPNPDPPPSGPYTASIVLVCRQEIAAGVTAPDPGADNGEVPPQQPNL